MLDGDSLPRGLVNALVHDAEATTCTGPQLANCDGFLHARMVATHGQAPPTPGSGLRPPRRPLLTLSMSTRTCDDVATRASPWRDDAIDETNPCRSMIRNGVDREKIGLDGQFASRRQRSTKSAG
jgi:hypothetical protein